VSTNRKLAIIGSTGRMGQEIAALALEIGFDVTTGVSKSSPLTGVRPSVCDVVIDFSLPEAVEEVIAWCVKNRKPLISGVTGLSEAQKKAYQKAGERIPVLWAPNMSLGVAVLARLLANLKNLEGFDFQIEELHHSMKRDKPSGTAVFLQEQLENAVGKPCPEPLAIRGGGIFGIHRVWAMGAEEVITLEHTAMSRRVFARGALKAAAWLLSQPAGFYRMDDVLGA